MSSGDYTQNEATVRESVVSRTSIRQEMHREILPLHYISGLVDGEGCFALNFRRDKRYKLKGAPEYFYWKVGFFIVLRIDDVELLEKVRDSLDCGIVSTSGNQARYSVNRIDLLKSKIVPFFIEYPLYGKKHEDFLLWAEAVDILWRNRRPSIQKGQRGIPKMSLESSDIQHILEIKRGMEGYKSKGTAWKWATHI